MVEQLPEGGDFPPPFDSQPQVNVVFVIWHGVS
jgi:hypothetical protein